MDEAKVRQVLAYLKANAVEPVNGFFYLGPDGIITGVTKVDEDKIALGCGCVYWSETGLPFASCRAHDRRTRDAKVGAALQELGMWLDEAAQHNKGLVPTPSQMNTSAALQKAAEAAVKAGKAMVRQADDL